jgi:hypothetical protein
MSFLSRSISFSDINLVNSPEVFIRALNRFVDDVSAAVNARMIGVYAGTPQPTGNKFNGADTSRVVMTIPSILSGMSTYPTGIPMSRGIFFSAIYGTAQNGLISLPLPYLNSATITDSIGLSIDLSVGN